MTDWHVRRETEVRQSMLRYIEAVGKLNDTPPPLSRRHLEVTARKAIREAAQLEDLLARAAEPALEPELHTALLGAMFKWAALAARAGLTIRTAYSERWDERV